jgi:16S rRNA (cytosine1402-N4)-methyltransferase
MILHTSVLLKETINGLNPKTDGIYVDATLGYAGHSSELLKKVKKGYLFAIDQDQTAIKASQKRLAEINSNFTIIHSNFSNLKTELEKLGITGIDGIIFDLGVSSPQLDEGSRGFSYHQAAKLDMRMNQEQSLSAYQVVNEYSETGLIRVLRTFGEEPYAKSIAKNIIKARPINTTLELVEVIKASMPEKAKRGSHPAKRTFQAIRIEVNSEISILSETLNDAIDLLKVGGRICVISFHSLEDRITKQVFKEASSIDPVVKGLPNIPLEYQPKLKLISKLKPTNLEIEQNNRARSAILRIAEKIKE